MKIKNLVAGKSIFNPVEGKRWLVQSHDKYIVDRRIVIFYLMILFSIFLYGASQQGFDFSQHYYFNCEKGPCENYFYGKCSMDWCSEKFLPSGFSYGEPPPYLSSNFTWIAMMLGFAAIIVNHFIYNRKFELMEA